MSFLLPPLPPTFEAALRDVRAKSKEARIAAAQRLAQASEQEHERAVSALSAQAADPDFTVRSAAVRALTELSANTSLSEAAERALIERVNDSHPGVRELALIALGRIGTAACGAALERALDSEHPEVRFQALAGYVEVAHVPAVERVIPLLEDSDPEVRGQAARAVATLAERLAGGRAQPGTSTRALAQLRALLSDTSPTARGEAAIALARLGDAGGEAQLGEALEHAFLRADALEAIARLGLRSLADRAFRIARNVFTPPADRVAIARTLAALDDARGRELLRAALRGLRRAPRALAVAAIGEQRIGALLPELLGLVGKAGKVDPDTLAEALAALAASHPEARAGLVRMAEAPGPEGEAARARLRPPPHA